MCLALEPHVGTTLTVFFEDPFWVGVCERDEGPVLEVARVVFGAEPSEAEVRELVLRGLRRLRFSAPDAGLPAPRPPARVSPKRAQRLAAALTRSRGPSTRAQEALRLAQEQRAEERSTHRREQRREEAEQRFALRQAKRKKKRRGH